MDRRALQARCKELKKYLPPGAKCTAPTELLSRWITEIETRLREETEKKIEKPQIELRPGALIGDLIGIVAIYTVPSVTYSLLTLDSELASRAHNPVLWRQKTAFERRGVMLDDAIIVKDGTRALFGWHTYYRLVNQREFGTAGTFIKLDEIKGILYGATGVSSIPAKGDIRLVVMTPNFVYVYTVAYKDDKPHTITEVDRIRFRRRCIKAGENEYLLEDGSVVDRQSNVLSRDAVDIVQGQILLRDRTVFDRPGTRDAVHILGDRSRYTLANGKEGGGISLEQFFPGVSFPTNPIVVVNRSSDYRYPIDINAEGEALYRAYPPEPEEEESDQEGGGEEEYITMGARVPILRGYTVVNTDGRFADLVLYIFGQSGPISHEEKIYPDIPPIKLLDPLYVLRRRGDKRFFRSLVSVIY